MISVKDAHRIIREFVMPLPEAYLPLGQLLGRVLAEDIAAPLSLPRFTNAAMDGFALLHDDIVAATSEIPVTLRVVAEVAAGEMPRKCVVPGTCTQIMTGAPIPEGADTVVPFEQTSGFGAGEVAVFSAPDKGANIRHAGEEIAEGSLLLSRGAVLTPGEIASLAALGIGRALAGGVPKVAIVTVGNELRLPGEPISGPEIYNSNRYMLEALCRACGVEPVAVLHAPDDRDALRKVFVDALSGCDMLVSSGGISTGEYDYVQELLLGAGVVPRFWTVAQKPGKPLYFGTTGEGLPVFALPGNPVSAMTCFIEYCIPALFLLQGRAVPGKISAVLSDPFPSDRKRHRFLPGSIWLEEGRLFCRVSHKVESHMITALAGSNGIIEAPPSREPLPAGTSVTCTVFPWSRVPDDGKSCNGD